MNKKISGQLKNFCVIFTLVIAVACKFFQFTMLPSKYFIDSNKILLMIQDSSIIRGTSYTFTADFFRAINFLNLSTILDWSICITVIFSIVFCIFLYSYKEYNIFQLLFMYVSMILLNIFSFNLGKEVLQILVFILIYLILINKKMTNKRKIVFINIILLLETIFFRSYYILVILGFDLTYWLLKRKIKFGVFSKILIILMIFLTILSLSKYVVPKYYNNLIQIRAINERNLEEANTLIKNVFRNNSSNLYYCLNYVINFFRILCPVELMPKGLKYILFALYQFSVVFIILKAIRKNDSRNYLTLSVVIGYFLASVTFEPDFGSVVRHESTMFLIILLLEKYESVFKSQEEVIRKIPDKSSKSQ